MVGRYRNKSQRHYTLIKYAIFEWRWNQREKIRWCPKSSLLSLWMEISIDKIKKIFNKKLKWSETILLWWYLLVYFQCRNKISTSQLCMLIDSPYQEYLDNFRKINIFVVPDGLQDLEYNVTKIKYEYLKEG